jgi:hypothetical protein
MRITSDNYDGQLANITFTPCSGGTINIGNVTLPYYYQSDYYYGIYNLYFPDFNKTCTLEVPCLSPTPTQTPTQTPTRTPAPSPTQTPTNTPTPTKTPTPTPTRAGFTCSGSVVPPATINGVEITATSTGSVGLYPDAFTSCGSITTPADSIYLGQGGAFTYTMNFSVPINNLIVFITGSGVIGNPSSLENFIFTTNTGTGIPSITSGINCFSTIVGNQIFAGAGDSPTGGGGQFVITNNVNFTSVTISGNGGSAGSVLSVCANSI